MAKLFANSGDPDQMLHSVASDLGLHCLPSTLLRVSRLQWVKFRNYEEVIKIDNNKVIFFLGHNPFDSLSKPMKYSWT